MKAAYPPRPPALPSNIMCMLKPSSGVHLSDLFYSVIQEVEWRIRLPTFHSQLKVNHIAMRKALYAEKNSSMGL